MFNLRRFLDSSGTFSWVLFVSSSKKIKESFFISCIPAISAPFKSSSISASPRGSSSFSSTKGGPSIVLIWARSVIIKFFALVAYVEEASQ